MNIIVGVVIFTLALPVYVMGLMYGMLKLMTEVKKFIYDLDLQLDSSSGPRIPEQEEENEGQSGLLKSVGEFVNEPKERFKSRIDKLKHEIDKDDASDGEKPEFYPHDLDDVELYEYDDEEAFEDGTEAGVEVITEAYEKRMEERYNR